MTATDAGPWIATYGDDAYDKAVEFTVIAINLGDTQGASLYAEAAKELMRRGYRSRKIIDE